jgi:hypothetical protein
LQEAGGGEAGGTGSPYYRLNAPHRRTHILLSAAFEPGPSPSAAAAGAGAAARRGSWSPGDCSDSDAAGDAEDASGGDAGPDAGVPPALPPGTWC